MADKSAIEWTDATWNPIVGCSILSPGCTNCYAMKMAARIERMHAGRTHYAGTTQSSKAGAVWTGKMALAPDATLTAPLRWKRGRRIFVNSMGDLFHESIPDEWIDRVFAVMALAPHHTFQVLTKRAERMRDYFAKAAPNVLPYEGIKRQAEWITDRILMGYKIDYRKPLPNVWLGVSTERQQEADERIPLLLQTPAAVRFISAEPLLGRIFLFDALKQVPDRKIDWVIVGGESGPSARPMHPAWPLHLQAQCEAWEIAFFFKQWGEWGPENWDDKLSTRAAWISPDGMVLEDVLDIQTSKAEKPFSLIFRHGKKAAGRLLDGREHNEFPEVRA